MAIYNGANPPTRPRPEASYPGRKTNEMNTRKNKIGAMMDCLAALRRGVAEPTIVREDDGSYSYVPGAWLSDISYTGSRAVVMTVEESNFGFEFDADAATPAELQAAAEYAADEWDWTVSD